MTIPLSMLRNFKEERDPTFDGYVGYRYSSGHMGKEHKIQQVGFGQRSQRSMGVKVIF